MKAARASQRQHLDADRSSGSGVGGATCTPDLQRATNTRLASLVDPDAKAYRADSNNFFDMGLLLLPHIEYDDDQLVPPPIPDGDAMPSVDGLGLATQLLSCALYEPGIQPLVAALIATTTAYRGFMSEATHPGPVPRAYDIPREVAAQVSAKVAEEVTTGVSIDLGPASARDPATATLINPLFGVVKGPWRMAPATAAAISAGDQGALEAAAAEVDTAVWSAFLSHRAEGASAPSALRRALETAVDSDHPDTSVRKISDSRGTTNTRQPYLPFSLPPMHALYTGLMQGAWLTSVDFRSGYQHIRLHPAYRRFFASIWQGRLYQSLVMLFGEQNAPVVFSWLSSALMLVACCSGVDLTFTYLDDEQLQAVSEEAAVISKHQMLALLAFMGVHVKRKVVAGAVVMPKVHGPTRRIEQLGIETCTVSGTLRLTPAKKLKSAVYLRLAIRLLDTEHDVPAFFLSKLAGVCSRLAALTHGLALHLGPVHHAAARGLQGTTARGALRGLLAEVLHHLPMLAHRVVEFTPEAPLSITDVVQTDASNNGTSVAVAAVCVATGQALWATSAAPNDCQSSSQRLEIAAILLAAACWGHTWAGRFVRFESDSVAAVYAINGCHAARESCAHLVAAILRIASCMPFRLVCEWNPRDYNVAADGAAKARSIDDVLFSLVSSRPDVDWRVRALSFDFIKTACSTATFA